MSELRQPFFVEEKIAALIPGRAVFFLCGVLLGACGVALHKSEPCYQARQTVNQLTDSLMRAKDEAFLYHTAATGLGAPEWSLRFVSALDSLADAQCIRETTLVRVSER